MVILLLKRILLYKIIKRHIYNWKKNGVKSGAIFVYIASDLLPVSRKRYKTWQLVHRKARKLLFNVRFVHFI